MKKLSTDQLELLQGGLVAPGPGEAERCRAQGFVSYIMLNPGNPLGLTPNDFTCYF
jgi:hypothetical protein